MSVLRRITNLFHRSNLDQEIEAELRSHIEMRTADNIAAGMSPEEARRQAVLRFGSRAAMKERVIAADLQMFLDSVWQDLCYGLRQLRRNPGFTVVAVLTLALGIGANTMVLSIVSGSMLRKPPVRDPDRLMIISGKNPTDVFAADRNPVSGPDYNDWQQQATDFSDMAAADFGGFADFGDVTITGGSTPELVAGARVSANFLAVLGVEPAIGRTFSPSEEQSGRDNVAILSSALWHSRFADDPLVLGRIIRLNGNPYTVVGVMPANFHLWDFDAQIWTPLVLSHEDLAPKGRSNRFLTVFARLKHGINQKAAATQMSAIAQRLASQNPSDKGWGARVMSLQQYQVADANVGTAMAFVMSAVGLVLLIACANLAGVLLARNSARQREFSVRAVLGAGPLRLARQLFTECLLLAAAGGSLGILFAYGSIRAIIPQFNWNSGAVALASEISIDARTLLLTAGVSILTAILVGIAPALRISRRSTAERLKESASGATLGPRRHRLQQLLVVAQITLSLILLTAAGLFVDSFIAELRASPGFDPRNVLTASVSLRGLEYFAAPQRQVTFFENALQQIDRSPQAESAAITSDLPFTFPPSMHFIVEGHPVSKVSESPSCDFFDVSPRYFETLHMPLLQGRSFTPLDGLNAAPVVIVDQAFAAKYFPHQNPIGHHILINPEKRTQNQWSEIVGVVGNVNEFLGEEYPRPHIFEPSLAHPSGTMTFVVRTRVQPGLFSEALRHAIWKVDGNQAISNVKTMERVVYDSSQGDNIMSELMGGFAALALVMAAIGIYGIVSYLVVRRTREISIRMALGASPREALALIMRGGALLLAFGLAAGILFAAVLPAVVRSAFSGTQFPRADWIVAIAFATVVAVALLACYIPARRASRVDPMVALRYE
jgi:predicted permease